MFLTLLLHTISQHPRPLSFAPQEALGRLPGQVLSTAGAGEEQGREVQKESDTEAGERLAPVSAGQTVLEKEPRSPEEEQGEGGARPLCSARLQRGVQGQVRIPWEPGREAQEPTKQAQGKAILEKTGYET